MACERPDRVKWTCIAFGLLHGHGEGKNKKGGKGKAAWALTSAGGRRAVMPIAKAKTRSQAAYNGWDDKALSRKGS